MQNILEDDDDDDDDEYPFFMFAKIIEQVLPVERGDRYEDPLSEFLEERGLGTVSGGGCALRDRAQPGEKDIEYAGLDIELANLDEALTLAKRKLAELGVPTGSEVEYTDADGTKRTEPIGELELLNVFIDKLSLSQEIYEHTDMKALCEGFDAALKDGNIGERRGPCSWRSELLYYFAGKSADEIFTRIGPLRSKFPILQNARVVFQRSDQEKHPKEIRLPFNNS